MGLSLCLPVLGWISPVAVPLKRAHVEVHAVKQDGIKRTAATLGMASLLLFPQVPANAAIGGQSGDARQAKPVDETSLIASQVSPRVRG